MLKSFLPVLMLLLESFSELRAQSRTASVAIDPNLKGDYRFTQSWDYPWDVIRDERTGKITKVSGEKMRAADTAHQFFTADCETNVQGGYRIRYCYATQQKDHLLLSFSDGLPAYASSFYVQIQNGQFSFRPDIVYPSFSAGEKRTYRITSQKLTLTTNKERYRRGDLLTGYLDVAFSETVWRYNKPIQTTPLYFRGLFRTPVR